MPDTSSLFSILSLLAPGLSQAGSTPPPDVQSPDINVLANQPQQNLPSAPVDDSPMRSYGNRDDRAEVQQANRQALEDSLRGNERAGIEPRKGIFGVHGTARDILGILGDSFLMSRGMQPIYTPRRQQEALADSLVGASRDPLAAAERSIGIGVDPKIGLGLLQNTNQNTIEQQKATLLNQKDQRSNLEKGAALFGQVAGASNPSTFPVAKTILERIKKQYGLGDDYRIPDEYDPDLFQFYQRGGVPTTAQLRDTRQIEAEQGRNTRASMQEAGRNSRFTPPTSKPSNPTEATELKRIRDDINAGRPLKPGDQQTWDRYIQGSKSKLKIPDKLPPGLSAPRRVTR